MLNQPATCSLKSKKKRENSQDCLPLLRQRQVAGHYQLKEKIHTHRKPVVQHLFQEGRWVLVAIFIFPFGGGEGGGFWLMWF